MPEHSTSPDTIPDKLEAQLNALYDQINALYDQIEKQTDSSQEHVERARAPAAIGSSAAGLMTHAQPAKAGCAESDDIEQYMSDLLARHGSSDVTVMEGDDDQPSSIESLVREAQALSPREPRKPAPPINLENLREAANATARNAIGTYDCVQQISTSKASSLTSLVTLVISVATLTAAKQVYSLTYGICLLMAVVSVIAALRFFWGTSQLRKTLSRRAAVEAAFEESDKTRRQKTEQKAIQIDETTQKVVAEQQKHIASGHSFPALDARIG